MYIHIADPAER